MVELKPYDPDAKCPKCGHDVVLTLYEDTWHYDCSLPLSSDGGPEHLDRYCSRCSYCWAEAPIKEEVSDG